MPCYLSVCLFVYLYIVDGKKSFQICLILMSLLKKNIKIGNLVIVKNPNDCILFPLCDSIGPWNPSLRLKDIGASPSNHNMLWS